MFQKEKNFKRLNNNLQQVHSGAGYYALFLYFLFIFIFIFVLAPMVRTWKYVKPITDYIEETGIDATALIYTEIEEFGPAESSMRNSIKYPPIIY